MNKKSKIIFIFIITFLILILILSILNSKTEPLEPNIEQPEIIDENQTYWAEKEEIKNFVGRVYEIKESQIKVKLIEQINNLDSNMVNVNISQDTIIEKSSIVEENNIKKLEKEQGSLEDIKIGQEITVFSNESILQNNNVTAQNITILSNSEKDWLTEFHGTINKINGNNLEIAAELPNQEKNQETIQVNTINLLITDDTIIEGDQKDLIQGAEVDIMSDWSILLSSDNINALKIKVIKDKELFNQEYKF